MDNFTKLIFTLASYTNSVKTSQTFTSAKTSVNSARVPALFKNNVFLSRAFDVVFDFGCGAYTEHINKYLSERDILYIPYDPYNRTRAENTVSICTLYDCMYDVKLVSFTCSNVLNVIQDDEIVKEIISISKYFANSFFTVYEGDRTGIGKPTKFDCFQRNSKISDYINFFDSLPYYCDSKIIYDRPEYCK